MGSIYLWIWCVLKVVLKNQGEKMKYSTNGAETIAWPSGKKKLAPTLVSHGAKILM